MFVWFLIFYKVTKREEVSSHLGTIPSWLFVYQLWCSECSLCLVPSLMVFLWEPIERLATPLFSHDVLRGFVEIGNVVFYFVI